MMHKKNHNEDVRKRVEDSLHSLDGMQRAKPTPFLLTRINARIQIASTEHDSLWFRMGMFLSRPAVAVFCLLLLLLINTIVINMPENEDQLAGKNTGITQRDEFAVNDLSIYENETNEP